MSERLYSVYKHTSPSGKVYIGITSQEPKKRWKYGDGYKGNQYFCNAIRKYGWKSFQHEILFTGLNEAEAKEKEILLIKQYDSTNPTKGYNKSPGGSIISEDSKKKQYSTKKRRGTFEKESVRMRKLWTDPKWRQKVITRRHESGTAFTEEHKMHISAALKGKPKSMQTRKKCSEAMKRRTGKLACRSRAVLKIDAQTLCITGRYVNAKDCARENNQSYHRITQRCSLSGGYVSHYVATDNCHYVWEDEYDTVEKIKTLFIPVRKPCVQQWSVERRNRQSRNQGKPVLCIETGEIFRSARAVEIEILGKPTGALRYAMKNQKPWHGLHWKEVPQKHISDEVFNKNVCDCVAIQKIKDVS